MILCYVLSAAICAWLEQQAGTLAWVTESQICTMTDGEVADWQSLSAVQVRRDLEYQWKRQVKRVNQYVIPRFQFIKYIHMGTHKHISRGVYKGTASERSTSSLRLDLISLSLHNLPRSSLCSPCEVRGRWNTIPASHRGFTPLTSNENAVECFFAWTLYRLP